MLIETLEAMEKNAFDCAKDFKEDGNEIMYNRLQSESAAYATVIAMLKDSKFASDIRAAYFHDEAKAC